MPRRRKARPCKYNAPKFYLQKQRAPFYGGALECACLTIDNTIKKLPFRSCPRSANVLTAGMAKELYGDLAGLRGRRRRKRRR